MTSELNRRLRGFSARHVPPEGGVKSHVVRRRPGLQRMKITALVVGILVAFCTDASSEPLLSAQDIENRIIGHSFEGRKGFMSVALHYGRDGTVTMRSPLGTGHGGWVLSDNRLCVKLVTGPRKVDECLTFTSQADGRFIASNGLQLTLTE